MKFMFVGITVFLLSLLSAAAFANPVLFSNPYDVNSSNAYNSTIANTGHEYQSFADYNYDGAAAITDFHWWGFTQGDEVLFGFQFDIYQDDGSGFPGTNVYSEYMAGDAGATAVGDDLIGFDIYKYGFDLANPWSGSAGKYWFSIRGVADNTDNARFYWALSSGRAFSNDLQYDNTGGAYIKGAPEEADFAYELTGNTVPEPATMTLFALGLLGTGIVSRKRKAKK